MREKTTNCLVLCVRRPPPTYVHKLDWVPGTWSYTIITAVYSIVIVYIYGGKKYTIAFGIRGVGLTPIKLIIN